MEQENERVTGIWWIAAVQPDAFDVQRNLNVKILVATCQLGQFTSYIYVHIYLAINEGEGR